MNLKVSLDRDIEEALQALGAPKRLLFKNRPIYYRLIIDRGMLKIKANNRKAEVLITPNAVDMAGHTIHIHEQIYYYQEEIQCEN